MRNENTVTVGAAITAFLEQCDVKAAFGVISIHNMPILDAFAQRGKTRFVMARGEAGAGNMADAYARSTSSLGVCITSTGPASGNIAGSLVEAYTAGTPLLHITGQIETQYLDQNLAYIHEAPDQLNMLLAVSKAAFRVRTPETCLSTLKKAVQVATTAPTGPVSVEIPIDIQQTLVAMPQDLAPPPSQSIGRLALARRAATRSRASGAGTATGIGSGDRSVGIGIKADWMSIGISTLTGPVGAVRAVCTASFRVLMAVSTLRTRKAALDTALSMFNWSRASWIYASSWSRYGVSICPVICSNGVPAVCASTMAPAALPAAVPVEVRHTPRPPVVRA